MPHFFIIFSIEYIRIYNSTKKRCKRFALGKQRRGRTRKRGRGREEKEGEERWEWEECFPFPFLFPFWFFPHILKALIKFLPTQGGEDTNLYTPLVESPCNSCCSMFNDVHFSKVGFPGTETGGGTRRGTPAPRTVGAASQWWSNEWRMAYCKLMMIVKCSLMMVKCKSMMVKWVYDHTLISPSLTRISPSLISILPAFAHLTII